MANEFENMQTAPVLTLEPFKEEETAVQVVEEKEVVVEEPILTPEEQAAVTAFANQIDLTNSNMILQYGAGTQKKMADFSESALDNVRTKDLGEVGDALSALVVELKGFGEEEELQDFIEGAEVLLPESASRPKVYYRNIPGQFIAGTVYDPVEKEVIIGAKCILNCGGKVWTAETDSYGDFWFKDLPVGVFDLVISADGFARKVFEKIRTRECQNLGDIPMERS